MSRHVLAIPALLGLAVVLAGCQNSGDHPPVNLHPNSSSVEGTWRAPSEGQSRPTIEFGSDGNYVATSFPDGLICGSFDDPDWESPVDNEGTWKITQGQYGSQVELMWPTGSGTCQTDLSVEKLDGELHLFVWIGDPDEDNTVKFVRDEYD